MAYQQGTATSIYDLVDQLLTFAVANGWTQDEYVDATAGYCTLHRDNCFVSLRWDSTVSTDLAVYQSLGWTSSVQPHQQTNDSGNGDTTVPINADRRVNFRSTGPFTQYYFFAHTDPYYIHIAVEVDAGRYRHFGFGHINKIGTWTGGEYAYGHLWDPGTTQLDLPTGGIHSFMLDTNTSSSSSAATMHAEGLPGEGGTSKWMVIGPGSGGTDRAGVARIRGVGGMRGGFWSYVLSWVPLSHVNVYKALIPVPVWYVDTAPAPDAWLLLGHQADVALVNMRNLNAADEISVGGVTWVVFPWVRKQYLKVDTEESWNAGVAYRKRV